MEGGELLRVILGERGQGGGCSQHRDSKNLHTESEIFEVMPSLIWKRLSKIIA